MRETTEKLFNEKVLRLPSPLFYEISNDVHQNKLAADAQGLLTEYSLMELYEMGALTEEQMAKYEAIFDNGLEKQYVKGTFHIGDNLVDGQPDVFACSFPFNHKYKVGLWKKQDDGSYTVFVHLYTHVQPKFNINPLNRMANHPADLKVERIVKAYFAKGFYMNLSNDDKSFAEFEFDEYSDKRMTFPLSDLQAQVSMQVFTTHKYKEMLILFTVQCDDEAKEVMPSQTFMDKVHTVLETVE